VLWRLGYYDESQKRLETAVTIADRHEQIGAELIAWCHLNMAAIQISQLRYLQAANILESINTRNYTNRELLAERLYLLGTVLYRTKRPEEAIKRFDEANHLIRQENRWLTSQLQFSKTEALMELGDQRAQDEFTKALELFERDKRRESLWRLYVTGSKLSEQKRDEADQYRQRARTLLKDLEAEWGSSHFRSYLSRPDIQRYSHPLS
jgi:tetratricopeptide (TPR) repeat protein